MTERPILFSGPMVRALLAGTKTQTRRIVKPQPQVTTADDASWRDSKSDLWRNAKQYARDCCPYGQPGDRLWVRETHLVVGGKDAHSPRVVYKATNDGDDAWVSGVWTPSIHMPRKFSRITLEITGVRVERLQDISEEDAQAEGVESVDFGSVGKPPTMRVGYAALWASIHGVGSFEKNEWVWVVAFRRVNVQ